jgi:hypothetical protein
MSLVSEDGKFRPRANAIMLANDSSNLRCSGDKRRSDLPNLTPKTPTVISFALIGK